MGIRILTREFVPSITSEEYDPDSGVCTIEYFLASKDPFRVCSRNRIPIPWPVDQTCGSLQARQFANSPELERHIQLVIDAHHMGQYFPIVKKMSIRGHYQALDTYVLNTDDEIFQRWDFVANDLQDVFDEAARKKGIEVPILVEIRKGEKMYKESSVVIKPGTLVHKACVEIEKVVYDEVRKSLPDQWTTISYKMRGTSDSEHPKPTIIITVSPHTKLNYLKIQAEIKSAIEATPFSLSVDFHLEIMPGAVEAPLAHPNRPIILRNLKERPQNDSSIGARGSKNVAGTFGVWVYFQRPGEREKLKCFLTAWNVVSSGNGEEKERDLNAIELKGDEVDKSIVIDYPAPFDASSTRERITAETTNMGDEDGESTSALKVISDYESAGGIGTAIHVSGSIHKSSNGHRMDWALVQLNNDDLFQRNKPPPGDVFSPLHLNNNHINYSPKLGERVIKVGILEKGDWVCMACRSFRATGEVNAMETMVRWENGIVSKELEALEYSGTMPFASDGCSGAMVVNEKREWVGIMVGRSSHTSWGYVCPARDVVEDIRERTGGNISLP